MAHRLIMEISEGGDRITLSDSSIYSVPAGDIPKAICWYASQRVIISPDRRGGVRIKNLDTFEEQTIRAKRITALTEKDHQDG